MKRKLSALVVCAAIASIAMPAAFGQEDQSVTTVDPEQLHVLSEEAAREALQVTATLGDAGSSVNATTATLPLWSYSVKAAQNSHTYSGKIVGTSPTATQKTTTVPAVLIPVILKITQGGVTYVFSPIATDANCLGGTNTGFGLTEASPLFHNATFTLNNVNVGDTQYADAFLRGEFWTYVKSISSPYHLLLSTSTKTALTISVNAGAIGNSTATVYTVTGTCGTNSGTTNPPGGLAVININTIDSLLQSYIKANGLNASQFPFFVTYNAVMSNGAANNLNDCCILGYHNALGNPGQTYGIAEFEGRDQTVFSGVSDVSAASHEVNEWVNDPFGSNPTPAWGNIGQVVGCQGNFEVGDPLSGSLMPPVSLNGHTYHLQQLAYFSWFYGAKPSLGTGGKYSSHGSFGGYAKLCPPGGTN